MAMTIAVHDTLRGNITEFRRVQQHVRLYEHLYQHFGSEPIAIYHWFRTRLAPSFNTPLILMLDEGRKTELNAWYGSPSSG